MCFNEPSGMDWLQHRCSQVNTDVCNISSLLYLGCIHVVEAIFQLFFVVVIDTDIQRLPFSSASTGNEYNTDAIFV